MYTKKCELCGDEFTAKRKNSRFCKKKHYKSCEVCQSSFLIKDNHRPSRTCSQSCASSLTHSNEARIKRKETSLRRYGVEHPFQSDKVKDKIRKSLDNSENDMRVGSKNWKRMMEEKYGVDNISQVDEIKDRKRQTYIEKYNVDNPMKSEDIILKREALMIDRYGTNRRKCVNVKNKEEFMNLKEFLSRNNMTVSQLSEYFEVKRDKMIREIHEQDVIMDVKAFEVHNSLKEEKFKNHIKDKWRNERVIINDRSVLNGKELDFYFPEHSLAVEISPARTHNVKMGFAGSPEVDKNYHLNKFIECDKKGIELITIFDWHDWDKVIEMIDNKLNKSNRIYARKTQYVEEKQIDKETFNKLSEWHILSLPSNFKRKNTVGKLIYNGVIVGLALWVKKENETELKRMVFKPGYRVIGGASKLLKNFISNNNPTSIVTFSDCDLGRGKVYEAIGFKLEEESKPQINYYHDYYKKHIKHLSLVMQGADRLLANFPGYKPVGMGEGLPSNTEIIEKYGFLTVYDCGYRKWRMSMN